MFILFYIIAYLTLVQCDKDIRKLADRLEVRRPNGKTYHDICKNFCDPILSLGKYMKCLDECQEKMKKCKKSCRKDKDRDPKKSPKCVKICVEKAMGPEPETMKPGMGSEDPIETKNPKLGLTRPNGKAYHDICKISCKYARPEKGAKMGLVAKYIKCLDKCEVIKKDCKISGKKEEPEKLRTYVNSCVKSAFPVTPNPNKGSGSTEEPKTKKPKTKKPKTKKPKTKKPKTKKPKTKKPKTKKPKPSDPSSQLSSSLQPSSSPSSKPSLQPSSKPSLQPSSKPSSGTSPQPSNKPSLQPSSKPSLQPSLSSQPSAEAQVETGPFCTNRKKLPAGDDADNNPDACVAEAKSDSDCTGIEISMVRTKCMCCYATSTCPPEPSDYAKSHDASVVKYRECS